MNIFTRNLIYNLQKYTVNEFIFYSLSIWQKYIDENNLMNEYITKYLVDKNNKEKIKRFVDSEGILNLKYSENKITKRLIIGFDLYISIRKDVDVTFRDFFIEYKEYLKTISINDTLKLKLLIYEIGEKVDLVPDLAMYDTMANADTALGYSIRYYNKQIVENIYIDIRCSVRLNLVILSEKRRDKDLDIIDKEVKELEKLLSEGLFNLIICNDYPTSLQPILPKETYKAQIENRVLKDELEVKYLGEIYRAIKLRDSYIALNKDLIAEKNQEKAKIIYSKVSLAKSFLK